MLLSFGRASKIDSCFLRWNVNFAMQSNLGKPQIAGDYYAWQVTVPRSKHSHHIGLQSAVGSQNKKKGKKENQEIPFL